jgi:hypothetical protein
MAEAPLISEDYRKMQHRTSQGFHVMVERQNASGAPAPHTGRT